MIRASEREPFLKKLNTRALNVGIIKGNGRGQTAHRK